MGADSPDPERSAVHTTELDWPERARRDGWFLSQGQWQHDARSESYDDGDWVYLGDGEWDDADLVALPADDRSELVNRYQALRAATIRAAAGHTGGGWGPESGGS